MSAGYLGPDGTPARPFSEINAASSGGVGAANAYSYVSAASANQTNITNAAASVFSVVACNNAAALRYVRLYNLSRAPTSADVPVWRGSLANAAGAVTIFNSPIGVSFSNGISFDITTGAPDNDVGVTTASDVFLNIAWH